MIRWIQIKKKKTTTPQDANLWLMEEILHQLIGGLSHYL